MQLHCVIVFDTSYSILHCRAKKLKVFLVHCARRIMSKVLRLFSPQKHETTMQFPRFLLISGPSEPIGAKRGEGQLLLKILAGIQAKSTTLKCLGLLLDSPPSLLTPCPGFLNLPTALYLMQTTQAA